MPVQDLAREFVIVLEGSLDHAWQDRNVGSEQVQDFAGLAIAMAQPSSTLN